MIQMIILVAPAEYPAINVMRADQADTRPGQFG